LTFDFAEANILFIVPTDLETIFFFIQIHQKKKKKKKKRCEMKKKKFIGKK
jgi:hypothetical protein